MIMATTSCSAGKVILSCEENAYRVRIEDESKQSMGEDEYVVFHSFEEAMEQFLADSEQLLIILDDSPGEWGGN